MGVKRPLSAPDAPAAVAATTLGGGAAARGMLDDSASESGGGGSAAASAAGGDGASEAGGGGGGGSSRPPAAKKKKTVAATGYGNDEALGYIAYHPLRDAPWGEGAAKPGAPIPYGALVALFERIESKGSRLYKTGQLANFLRSAIALSPADALPTIYLCTATLAPAFEGLEMGIGDGILAKVLAETTGKKLSDVKDEVKAADGDFGPVAEAARAKQRTLSTMMAPPPPLTVRGVYAALRSIASESGTKSQDKKMATIKKMLVAAKGLEARYLMRTLQSRLRIGLTGKTVPVALAHAITLTAPVPPTGGGAGTGGSECEEGAAPALGPLVFDDAARCGGLPAGSAPLPPVSLAPRGCGGEGKRLSPSGWEALDAQLTEASEALKAIWSELPSYDAIVPKLLRSGIEGAAAVCQLTPGIPVSPMLAKPTKGVAEILDRLDGKPFTCEFKYDGERAQVHALPGGAVRIFSRNSEETTSRYPDLAETLLIAMGRAPMPAVEVGGGGGGGPPPVQSCVLDGEAVAFDPATGRLLPFQVLSTRQRKDATLASIKVPVIYVAFDLLFLNGESLLKKSLEERRAVLRTAFRTVPNRFSFAVSKEGTDTEEIGAFLTDAIAGGCEGLMVKALTGPESLYAPDKRSLNWLKLKKDYMDGLSDSLDLVPVAAWHGKGKRAGVYGVYLLACYDAEADEYQSVCKVGTGFSEEALESLAQGLSARSCTRTEKPPNVMVGETLAKAVDVWFSPEDSEVWEIRAADLSISPVHMAAVGKVDPERGIGLRFPRFLHKRVDKAPSDATSADTVLEMYRSQASVRGKDPGDDDDD
jgi:DNA ligase-1